MAVCEKLSLKEISSVQLQFHLTLGQVKPVSHVEKDALWIDGLGNWNVASIASTYRLATTCPSKNSVSTPDRR